MTAPPDPPRDSSAEDPPRQEKPDGDEARSEHEDTANDSAATMSVSPPFPPASDSAEVAETVQRDSSLTHRESSNDDASDKPESSDQVLKRLESHAAKESRYDFKGEIARGGMGAILKVWDHDLRRNLAMKVVLGKDDPAKPGSTSAVDDASLGRFLEEAQVTGQLDHPGVVPVHELSVDATGQVYFTMRLVKGRDLSKIFELVQKGEEGWSQARAVGVILKVCEAMAYAHSKHVIHRDLKPANIMVGRFGEVYVMDWGVARVLGEEDRKDIRLRPAPETTLKVRTDRRHESAPDSPSPKFVTIVTNFGLASLVGERQ